MLRNTRPVATGPSAAFTAPVVGLYSAADAQNLFDWWLPTAGEDRARLLARELRRRTPSAVPLAIVHCRDGSVFGVAPVAGELYGFTTPPVRELAKEEHGVAFRRALLSLAGDLAVINSLEQLDRALADYTRKVPLQTGKPSIIALPMKATTDEAELTPDQPSIIGQILHTYQDGTCSHVQVDGNHRPPQPTEVRRLVDGFMPVLFPGYHGPRPQERGFSAFICRRVSALQHKLTGLVRRAVAFRREVEGTIDNIREDAPKAWADKIVLAFFEQLPGIRRHLEADVSFASTKDPALPKLYEKVYDHHEMLLAYPGLWAVAVYRLAHQLYALNVPYLPRMMTEYAHSATAIDIHPGAKIAPGFFIDHGSGVVIGQTAIIEKNVTIYQGVTLGALNFPRTDDGDFDQEKKRHPSIAAGTTVFAHAAVLGDVVVGAGSTIGANVSLRQSVEAGSQVRVPHTLRELSISGQPMAETAAAIVLAELKRQEEGVPGSTPVAAGDDSLTDGDPEAYLPKEFRRSFTAGEGISP